jgi:hypothetical protein
MVQERTGRYACHGSSFFLFFERAMADSVDSELRV